ncbi:unnamed protein product [Victoria cruziana]
MSQRPTITAVFLSVLFMSLTCSAHGDANAYLRSACHVTLYRELCFNTFAAFPSAAKQNASALARSAISVTLAETKNVTRYILGLRELRLREREREALEDCIENFGDALDNLHKSLFEIRSLDSSTFDFQVSNMQTWMSAVLTSQDTCLDGFNGTHGAVVEGLNLTIGKVARITSNALALINTLAETGGRGLVDP